jgi:transposase-like protein
VAEQRYKAVQAVVAEGRTVTEVAGEWTVSRQTLHSWLAKYEAEGLGGARTTRAALSAVLAAKWRTRRAAGTVTLGPSVSEAPVTLPQSLVVRRRLCGAYAPRHRRRLLSQRGARLPGRTSVPVRAWADVRTAPEVARASPGRPEDH